MNNPTIKIKELKKKFGKHEILKNINLELFPGKILGLIGPSGSGKTTLIKCLLGVENPDYGETFILGTKMPNRKILNKIGYMAQSDALYDHLTGKENLSFFGSFYDLPKKDLNENIKRVSEIVNLIPDLDKYVGNYSGGMKRRLSLAIALLPNPDVIILDEPTVGIDPILRMQIWHELTELKNSGKTILVTTHVMDEAEHCDDLALIQNGRFITQGSPKELKEKFNVKSIEEVYLRAEGEEE